MYTRVYNVKSMPLKETSEYMRGCVHFGSINCLRVRMLFLCAFVSVLCVPLNAYIRNGNRNILQVQTNVYCL